MLDLGNGYEVFSVKFFQLFCSFESFHVKCWGKNHIFCDDI